MFNWFNKLRKHPKTRDEQGRSAKQQAFDLFYKGYRPSEIFKEKLVPLPMKTLLRYFEEWKKQTSEATDFILTEYLDGKLGLSRWDIKELAQYFGVSEAHIFVRMQKPLGVLSLLYGEIPDNRLRRIRKEIERRLEAALKLMYLTENLHDNSPEEMNRYLAEILTLEDNTQLIVSKVEGRLVINKEVL